MELENNVTVEVDKVLAEPNPVLFCARDGSPITFHVEAGKDEKQMIRAVQMVASDFGGKYICHYSDMTPYTVLLVTDEGFKKRKYSRPAICITYVGDCINSNSLLDINNYLHPWEDKDKWKHLNLFHVVYFFMEKFPMFETPRKRNSQDGTLNSTMSILSPSSSHDSSLKTPVKKKRLQKPNLSSTLRSDSPSPDVLIENQVCFSGESSGVKKKLCLNPSGSSPLRSDSPCPDDIPTQNPVDENTDIVMGKINLKKSSENETIADACNAAIAADNEETSKSKESHDKLAANKTVSDISDTGEVDVVLKSLESNKVDNKLSRKKTEVADDDVTVCQSINADGHLEIPMSVESDNVLGLNITNVDERNKEKRKEEKGDERACANEKRASSPLNEVSSSVTCQTAPASPQRKAASKVSSRALRSVKSSSSSRSSTPIPPSDVTSIYSDAPPYNPPRRGRGAQDRYKTWEQNTILRYLVENNKFRNLKGVTVWKDMVKKEILPNRPWQSLKNQFLKNILKNLDKYPFLSQEEKNKFLNPPAESSSDDDDSSFFYAGDLNKSRRPATRSRAAQPDF